MSERIVRYLREHGIEGELIVLPPDMAKTSQLAASAVGCEVAQIAKNIVLRGSQPYLVILSGDRRVDLVKASKLAGEKLVLMEPDQVLKYTGYPVGGVPPFGHTRPLKTWVDKSIARFELVYTSGGSPDTLLKITVSDLVNHLRAPFVDVSR
ncbi:Cys-tRNA(Pro)/Cys-tRNA(Cys) deacylase YbaK [archaeon HR01]|nr:Cys-tRNA(Pro)/Cys-tRNA(Cys) deacylase YbaK [archaeon HR01]